MSLTKKVNKSLGTESNDLKEVTKQAVASEYDPIARLYEKALTQRNTPGYPQIFELVYSYVRPDRV